MDLFPTLTILRAERDRLDRAISTLEGLLPPEMCPKCGRSDFGNAPALIEHAKTCSTPAQKREHRKLQQRERRSMDRNGQTGKELNLEEGNLPPDTDRAVKCYKCEDVFGTVAALNQHYTKTHKT